MAPKKAPTSEEMDESRQIALDKALGDITKRYGDGTIMRRTWYWWNPPRSHHRDLWA